ncbi:UPF2 [Blepharisma stoltei]|uniref:MIF4G domain-containing protein n=1 Tax=Blepharisma stoltei TaxID=1481888 RepID=A0AAU9IIN0_9CILI|nr:unnamed protein product [Blepharisma stoltei]
MMEDLGFSAEDLALINSAGAQSGKGSKDYYEPQIEEMPDLSPFSEEAKQKYIQSRDQEIHKRKMRYLNKICTKSPQPEKKGLITKVDRIQKFIKKLKTFSEESAEAIIQEMDSLNLNRYVSEVAGSISETKMQLKELPFLIDCCCGLHQRYPSFSKTLEECLKKQHKESDNVRKRSILRFITELIIHGLWEDTKGYLRVIQNYATSQGENLENSLSILSSIFRYRSEELLGFPPVSEKILLETRQIVPMNRLKVLDENEQKILNKILTQFYESSMKYLLDLHDKCKKVEARNTQIKIERSVVDEESSAEAVGLRNKLNKCFTALQIMSDVSGFEPPVLIEEKPIEVVEEIKEVIIENIFDSEEEKNFYLKLPIFEERKNKEEHKDLKAEFETFKKKFGQCVSKEEADTLAEEFLHIANKSNRKALVGLVGASKTTTLHLLPFYARLIAIVGREFKDVNNWLLQKLESDFKQFQEQNDATSTDNCIRQVKLMSELLKFQIAQPSLLINCLESCLSGFSGQNIEIACHTLNSCGRYLYKHPVTNERITLMVSRMQRLKTKKHLPPETEHMVDESCYSCVPREKVQKKKSTPILYEYIKWLIKNLEPSTCEKTIKDIKMLPFPESEEFIVKAIIQMVSKGKIQNIPIIANMLAGIRKHSPLSETIHSLIDTTCEDILMDLKENNFRKCQHRVLIVKFFGELYCYKIIDKELVYDMLFALLYYKNENDDPTDTFRAKLIWSLLDSVKEYFIVDKHRQKINRFLTHFQYFLITKPSITKDMEFLVTDILETFKPNPKLNRENYKEIMRKLLEEERKHINDSESEEESKDPKTPEMMKIPSFDTNSSEEEKEFDNELEDFITESIHEAKSVGIIKEKEIPTVFSDASNSGNFKLLFKKGGRVQAKTVMLPTSHALTQRAEERQKIHEREREHLARVVTELHQRSLQEEHEN